MSTSFFLTHTAENFRKTKTSYVDPETASGGTLEDRHPAEVPQNFSIARDVATPPPIGHDGRAKTMRVPEQRRMPRENPTGGPKIAGRECAKVLG